MGISFEADTNSSGTISTMEGDCKDAGCLGLSLDSDTGSCEVNHRGRQESHPPEYCLFSDVFAGSMDDVCSSVFAGVVSFFSSDGSVGLVATSMMDENRRGAASLARRALRS